MTTVWSYGGGVQSAAIGVLIARGDLPTPDLAVIADTGREASSTWRYLREVMQPYLGPLAIEVAPHDLATVDLYGKNGDLLIPAFTAGGGKLPTFCSNEWKRRVVARWLRARGVRAATLWLGISVDELHRARTGEAAAGLALSYPLIDLRMTRGDCLELVRGAGLEVPEKSACWMCPLRNDAEWRALRDRSPDDWRRAVALEQAISARDPGVFLHRSLRRIGEADIAAPETGQQDLFCESGFCWT